MTASAASQSLVLPSEQRRNHAAHQAAMRAGAANSSNYTSVHHLSIIPHTADPGRRGLQEDYEDRRRQEQHLHLRHPAVVPQLHGDDGHADQLPDVVERLHIAPALQAGRRLVSLSDRAHLCTGKCALPACGQPPWRRPCRIQARGCSCQSWRRWLSWLRGLQRPGSSLAAPVGSVLWHARAPDAGCRTATAHSGHGSRKHLRDELLGAWHVHCRHGCYFRDSRSRVFRTRSGPAAGGTWGMSFFAPGTSRAAMYASALTMRSCPARLMRRPVTTGSPSGPSSYSTSL